MDASIHNHRETCLDCIKNAPSQQKEPLVLTPLPLYPFEKICANYFFVENKPYLAIVDRLSGWLSLYAFKPNQANHSTLIDTFRYLFTVYGVSEELSSDGGPQFAAKEFQEFLKLWQVKHRLSSVAYPRQTEGQSLGSKLRNVLFIIIFLLVVA